MIPKQTDAKFATTLIRHHKDTQHCHTPRFLQPKDRFQQPWSAIMVCRSLMLHYKPVPRPAHVQLHYPKLQRPEEFLCFAACSQVVATSREACALLLGSFPQKRVRQGQLHGLSLSLVGVVLHCWCGPCRHLFSHTDLGPAFLKVTDTTGSSMVGCPERDTTIVILAVDKGADTGFGTKVYHQPHAQAILEAGIASGRIVHVT